MVNTLIIKDNKFALFFLTYIFIFIIKIRIIKSECDKTAPYLRNNACSSIICQDNELLDNSCSIDNSIIKTQWINNILIFNDMNYWSGEFAVNDDGDMIIEYSSNGSARLFYGLKNDGSYYFNDDTTHTKIINIENSYRYESKNIFIYINNKQYLFSTGTSTSVSELYDLENIDTYSIKTTSDFLGFQIFSFAYSLLKLETTSTKEYLIVCTYTASQEGDNIALKKFLFNQNNFDDVQISPSSIRLSNADYRGRTVSGFTMNSLIIIFYLSKLDSFEGYIIKIYDFNLLEKKTNTLNAGYTISDFVHGEGLFSKSICLNEKDKIVVFIFYTSPNNGHPYSVVGSIDDNYNFSLKIKKQIEEYNFVPTRYILNDLIKINDNRFAFITVSSDQFVLYILIFDLYDSYSKMKIRIYQPNLNKYKYVKEISTTIYNNYLAFSSTVILSSSSNEGDYFSILMIFGYVKGIDNTIDISPYFMDNEGYNQENNLVMKLIENITIDNNIFGYQIVEKIKLISIPEQIFFYNSEEKIKLANESELNKEYIFKQNIDIIKTDELYILKYQFIVEERESYTDYIINEINEPSDDSSYTFQKTKFYGKTNTVKFKLCHDYCASCNEYGISNNDQKCMSCLENYTYDYFNEYPSNCIPEGHFNDKENGKLEECTETNSKFYFDETRNKKICFKNTYSCPTNYRYYNSSTRECQNYWNGEICTYENLVNNACSFLNLTNTEIYNKIKEEIIQNYPEDGISIVIEGKDNYIFQLTNGRNELDSLNGDYDNEYNLSMIDIGKCEELLREQNVIDNQTELIILKFEKITNKASEKNVQYEIYAPNSSEKLDLSICRTTSIDLYIPITLSETTQNLYDDLSDQGYDLFNENDSFYQDICATFKSENGTDVLLSDRKNDYYNPNETICQANCHYSAYISDEQYLKCKCGVTIENIDTEEPEKLTGKLIFTSFYNVLKYSNVGVLKCYKLVFDINNLINNYGCIIMIIYFLFYFICFMIFAFKGFSPLKIDVAKLLLKSPLNEDKSTDIHLNNISKQQHNKVTNDNNKSKFNKNKKKKLNEIKFKNNKVENKGQNNHKKSKKSNGKNTENNSNHKKTDIKNEIKIINLSVPPKRTKYDHKNSVKESEVFKINLKKDNKIKAKKSSSNLNYDNVSVTIHKTQSLNSKRIINETKNNNDLNLFNNEQTKIKLEKKESINKKEEEKLSDFELNDLEYLEAIELDKRSFGQIYWSLLKREHIILFTFFSWNDYNIIYVKFARFFSLIGTDMAMNVFFFSDDSMHKIYLNYGKYDFVQQIPKIIYSTAISQLLEVFLCFLSLTDKYFYEIKSLKKDNHIKEQIFPIFRCVEIKLIIFFIFTCILFAFYWYFVSAFCAVYQNTQFIFIKDSASSFLTGLLYPFVLYLIPSVLRILSLNDAKKKRFKFLYKLSDIIPFF